ncbi:MAG TPA: hypothetical protein PLL69_08315, partial [Gemmatimonadales bacterium]|nr:hypothetical protein [Gemmatimonadales bacterium]
MSRTLLTLVLLLAGAPGLAAQLPYLTVPGGALRLELAGAFLPATSEFADGKERPLGAPLEGSSALLGLLDNRLTNVLGRPAASMSSGSLTAQVMQQRGEGYIGAALGITSRLTISGRIPIVSTRTEAKLQHDPTGADVGINPLLLGDESSAIWAEQFGDALGELAARVDAGEYNADPDRLALANQILAEAPAWRTAMGDLLATDGRAVPVLPLAGSEDGAAILARAGEYRDQLANTLGISSITASPALPVAPLGDSDFALLRQSPGGFGYVSDLDVPFVALGDIEAELTYQLAARANPESRSWFGAWASAGASFPNGTTPRQDRIRDQGTGDRQFDVVARGTLEAGRGRFGLRGSAEWRNQMARFREVRRAGRDEFLVPAVLLDTLEYDPGNVFTLHAQPFFRLADRLAITGSFSWTSRG